MTQFILQTLVVSYLAYNNQNWFLLFGILFSYLGSVVAAYKSKIIYLAILFCVGFLIISGFDFYQYVTFFFFCLLSGYIIFLIAEEFDQQSKRGTLDNDKELLDHVSSNGVEIGNKTTQYFKRASWSKNGL